MKFLSGTFQAWGQGCLGIWVTDVCPRSILPKTRAATWPGYTRDRLQMNFLELFLPSKHRRTRDKRTLKKAPNFLEAPVLGDFRARACGKWTLGN